MVGELRLKEDSKARLARHGEATTKNRRNASS
jgi:hypothetical protein